MQGKLMYAAGAMQIYVDADKDAVRREQTYTDGCLQ